ncbi:hypothetical protein FA13DRAFT_1791455 [Coprinellus micaceus]|uniref:F-box domain-containing protein n=1 Tax=Coprinellus micaceus TaxID=71717 RepID=A0A4Y7TBZ8_COPMI|nr:hypothetical protein FA13DRAFT_1791455 [Coprinellus micaceus]
MSTPVPFDVQRSAGRAPILPRSLKLPLELLDLIVGHVCAAFDHCDLRSLSLTAKRFTSACQKVLFEAVTLQPAKFVLDDHEQIGPGTAERFAILISESPHLAAFVKALRYRVVYGPAQRPEGRGQPLPHLYHLKIGECH